MVSEDILPKIVTFAEANDQIEVLWLYGSRARGDYDDSSDYDLAIAFKEQLKDGYAQRLRPEELAMSWSEVLGADISVVDVALAPAALAVSIINEGRVMFCVNSLRLHFEEQKAWSKWEGYKYAYEHYSA